MTKALKCDRCGEFYEPSNKASDFVLAYPGSYRNKIAGDLCPKCTEKLLVWWKKKKKVSE